MAKQSAHPDKQLFDYLNGSLDQNTSQMIEQHLASCAGCASVADLVRALKSEVGESSQSSNIKSEIAQEHPDISAIASFFYANRSRARNSQVAAHIALCQSCATEIAEYARAESAASRYNTIQGEMPAQAWEMIREWEESSFAKPKPASEAIGQELLAKLSNLLSEQREQLAEAESENAGMVPVIVVDREGEMRSVEMFKKIGGTRGQKILEHAEKSERFDNKPVHVLLDFGEENRVVVSERIRRDTVRLKQPARQESELRHADYFIIED
ncbi:MAG TPA: zf-HC2 domain-containing protein [Blastocatellia bacterium]|nr:zf-HC2 domain-containing protein [Blastocatellia bacterium]